MEDEHVVMENLTEVSAKAGLPDDKKFRSFFGVFDGHCGRFAAEFCRDNLPANLYKNPHYADAQSKQGAESNEHYSKALEEAFIKTDKDFLTKAHAEGNDAGCTAISALLTDHSVIVGNLGDARCILSRGGKAIDLSKDHKPGREDEKARILRAGGFVVNGRINSFLAVSRAIGDRDYKNWEGKVYFQADLVSSSPDIHVEPLTPVDDFLVLACDGVWDVMSSQDVVDFLRKMAPILEQEVQSGDNSNVHVASEPAPQAGDDYSDSSDEDELPQNQAEESKSVAQKLADKLTREAIQRGSTDNVTAIVVRLKITEQ